MAYVCVMVEFPDEDWQGIPEAADIDVDDLADRLVRVATSHGYVARVAMGQGQVDPRWGRPQVQRHGRR
jgi:hypothetical protein